jgi:hypothetical protein
MIMKKKQFIICALVLTIICFSFLVALGETKKIAVPLPKDIEEQKFMEAAMSECVKMKYELQKEEGKTICRKEFYAGIQGYEISIMLSVAPGENGRKVMNVDGELIGNTLFITHKKPNLYQDLQQVENAVKKVSGI